MAETARTSFLDKVNALSLRIAGPMSKFSSKPSVAAIQNGLVGVTPIILIGSIFLVLYTLATPSIGGSGEPLIPWLAAYAPQLMVLFNLTFGILALYCAVTISYSYAQNLKSDTFSCAILGLASFLMINIGSIEDGKISIGSFGASGLVTTILVSLLAVRAYAFLIDRGITIKLPDSIPTNVLKAFTSLVPYLVVLTLLWIVRTLLGFDFNAFLTTVLAPVIHGADNIAFFLLNTTGHGLFWSVGLHWDNMVSGVVTPLTTLWTLGNIDAYIANSPLEYIYTTGLYRITIVPGIFYPPLILLLVSKLKQLRATGIACLPAAVFCITEPITFGVLAFNPFFVVPMILSGLVAGIITYGSTLLGILPQFHLELPWATPTFLYGPVGTGSFMGLLIQFVVIAVGLCIYFPFFKAYEKSQAASADQSTDAAADSVESQTA